MKQNHFLCAILACLSLFASCEKEQHTSELVSFKVGYRLVDPNSMYQTKAIPNEEVAHSIAQCLPTSISLVFKDTNGGVVVVNSGAETTLPAGTYTVTGTSYGEQVGDLINTNCYLTHEPYIVISDQITISKDVTEYTVSGTFKSFAIVVDYDEISSATYKNISSQSVEVPFRRFDNLGLVFAQGNYSNVPLQITLSPQNTSQYQETSFGFSTNSTTQKYTYVEPGKYYKLHPAAKGSVGPVIGVGFPEFAEGTVKID